MDTLQNTALMRALAELPGPLPARGVIQIVIPHTDRFTVVGNHLAQHPGLSTVAVGFAVRIQSLPQGAEIGVKALAARFPEGEKRIAAALRELEAHGYLQRARTRLPNGRIVTRTVFCNQPAALLRPRVAAVRPQLPPTAPQTPPPVPDPAPEPPAAEQPSPEAPAPQTPVPPDVQHDHGHGPEQPHAHAHAHEAQDHAPFISLVPPPTAPKPPRPPLPRPRELTPELDRAATALLSDLRRHAPQLVLSENDIRQLAPAVAAWLEREARPDTIRHTLTHDLPQPLRNPAKLLKHRLSALIPPPLPGAGDLTPPPIRRITVTPFQTCDGCERAFRSPAPGHCRDCRTDSAQAAA
ncbi:MULTISPECIES: hypothetical protein [unclassified Streptomyces]|uniref:hypothetical protein n=1 Tax=unclassified Streptomyces TaxID=2593676 RepID=UPI000AB87F8C|nr:MULTISPECIES: hypothetical protein [unclassified Streptomyces]MYR97526.1 hypothetical protein [Streptomyces sp. SID4937]